jgi:glutamine synthetase
MEELDEELWKLGVPATTKHNEVAPAQHELAPIFQTTNAAIDSNLITMELMRKLAPHQGLVCLQHEKPFEGINGGGKHNNWSISADGENLQFLVFLTAVIKAVDEYQGLLRMSVASAGNDHRLGANEAPPAIISIFLGDELEAVVRAIVDSSEYGFVGGKTMDLGVPVLPTFIKDNTDRNRTSPFAFTGNKFEFRMPGSEVNLSDANMILNTIVAKTLADFAEAMDDVKKKDFEKEAKAYLKSVLSTHERIIFNGDNYSEEWPKEAKKRGLLNLKSTPEALPQSIEPGSIELFERFGIMNEAEVHSRYEVKLEHYSKKINIEALVTARMSRARFLPAIISYSSVIANAIDDKREVSEKLDTSAEEAMLAKLTGGINAIYANTEKLEAAVAKAATIANAQKQADEYLKKVLPAMEAVRTEVDAMELIVGHDYWPVPSYNHMLFYT